MPDFKAQMEVFTQDQMDVYIIALISTYSKSRSLVYRREQARKLLKPFRGRCC